MKNKKGWLSILVFGIVLLSASTVVACSQPAAVDETSETGELVELYSLNKYTLVEKDLPQNMSSIMLRTIERWEGDSSKEIKFKATKSP